MTHEFAWRKYFEVCGVKPFTVIYEELVTAYEETALLILSDLGIPCPEPLALAERRLKQQADALSEEWVKQYYHLKRIL
jgi:LPS sulfotransferase NodH